MNQSENKKFSAPLGAGLVILSSFFYASYGIWTKLLGNFFDGYTASALRSILVILILGTIAFTAHKLEPLNLRKNWLYILGMVFSSLFTWGPLYFAILYVGVGVSLTVNYASIVIGMFFFGWLLAKEKFTQQKAFSAVLGIIGLVLIFLPSTLNLSLLALLGAVVSGLSASANAVFTKQIRYKATQATLSLWAASSVANIVMAFVLGKHYPSFNGQIQWLYLLFFALASVIASWALVQGIKIIDAGSAGILGLLEIVFGVVFGLIFFHEKLSIVVVIGILIVITAAAIPYMNYYQAKDKQLS